MTNTTETKPTVARVPTEKRIPFGVKRSKLEVTKLIPGYRLVWVNDLDGRLDQALEGGYEFVSPEEVGRKVRDGNKVYEHAGTDKQGAPYKTYLMKILQEWYEEDQKPEKAHLDEIDKAIKGGTVGANANDGRYVPKNGIKLS
jgi:hypothetical protein